MKDQKITEKKTANTCTVRNSCQVKEKELWSQKKQELKIAKNITQTEGMDPCSFYLYPKYPLKIGLSHVNIIKAIEGTNSLMAHEQKDKKERNISPEGKLSESVF